MLQKHPTLGSYASHSAFALLFLLFLLGSPATVVARPMSADHRGTVADSYATPQQKGKVNKARFEAKDTSSTQKIRVHPLANVSSGADALTHESSSLASSLDWIRTAIKSLLIGVWANISAYTKDSSSGGHCS